MDLKLNPDQIRRSVYARQWSQGFSNLRFDTRLEQEFRLVYGQRMLPRRRLVLIVGIVLFALFAVVDALRLSGDLRQIALILRLGVVMPLLVVTLWIAYSEAALPADCAICC